MRYHAAMEKTTGSSAGWHPRSRFVELSDGWRAHFVELGQSGPPLILIHGILVSSWAWRFNLDYLARRHRVFALCQKGFGYSEKRRSRYDLQDLTDFLRRFMDRLGIERAHLAGNSLGGAVSMRLALDDPSRVDKLVLVNAAGLRWRLIDDFAKLQSVLLSPIYRTLANRWAYKLLLANLAYANLPIDRDYMEGFLRPLRARGAYPAFVATLRHVAHDFELMQQEIERIRHETLIVWGAKDRLVPLKSGFILNNQIRRSRLEIFYNCSHCPHEEDPARFNRLVDLYLNGEDSPR